MSLKPQAVRHLSGLSPTRTASFFSAIVALVMLAGVVLHLSAEYGDVLRTADRTLLGLAQEQSLLIGDQMQRFDVVLSQAESRLNILRTLGDATHAGPHDLLRNYQNVLPDAVDLLLLDQQGKTIAASAAQGEGVALAEHCLHLAAQRKIIDARRLFTYTSSQAGHCPPRGTLIYSHPLKGGREFLWLMVTPEAFTRILANDLPDVMPTARSRVLGPDRSLLAELSDTAEGAAAARFPLELSSPDLAAAMTGLLWRDSGSDLQFSAVSAGVKGTDIRVQIIYPTRDFIARFWWPEARLWLLLVSLVMMAWALLSYVAMQRMRLYQDALLASESRFDRSLDFAAIGVWDWNIDSGHLYWSRRIAPMFGYGEGDTHTSYANFLAALHPDDRAAVQAAVNASVETGAPYHIEHRVVWPDGSVRWLEERGAVLDAIQGGQRHMLGVVLDITERKRLMAELDEHRNHLEALVASRTAELARTKSAAEADSLAYRSVIEPTNFTLEDVLGAVAGVLGPSAAAKGLQLRIELPPELATRPLQGDPPRLKQILLNLVANGIQFTPAGSVVVQVTLLEDGAADRLLRFAIIDTGSGIPPAVLPHLFDAVGQADSALPRQQDGSGLGLAISKRLVEMMGGEIGVTSREGLGSTFWFTARLGNAGQASRQTA